MVRQLKSYLFEIYYRLDKSVVDNTFSDTAAGIQKARHFRRLFALV